MKKHGIKKLALHRETLRHLTANELALANAAVADAAARCLTDGGCQTASCPGQCTVSCVTCAAANCSKIIEIGVNPVAGN